MSLLNWIVWLALALSTALVFISVGLRLHFRRAVALFLGVVVLCGMLTSLFLISLHVRPAPVRAEITSPVSVQHVSGDQLMIEGRVSPPDARVTVVVRSETDTRWWVQSVVTAERIDALTGHWSVHAHIGTPEAGQRQSFELVALASANSRLFDALTGRAFISGTPQDKIPLWAQSEPVVVWREK